MYKKKRLKIGKWVKNRFIKVPAKSKIALVNIGIKNKV